MSIFEIVMLLSFGAAWPASIYKSYTARSNSGKSLLLLVIVLVGYASGILHKIFYNMDGVIYLFNAALVFCDMLLYVRNARYDRQQAQKS